MMRPNRSKTPGFRKRRGVAATETAVTLPVLVLLVFGCIELANGVFLKQALTVAAYEGAREATRPGATAAEAEQRIAEVLAARSIPEYEVVISPQVERLTARNTQVSVTVTAPGNTYSLGLLPLFESVFLEGETRMVRQ